MELTVHDPNNAHKPFGMGTEPLPENAVSLCRGQYLLYKASYPGIQDFGAAAKVIAVDGSASAGDGRLCLSGCTEAVILIKLFANTDHEQAWEDLLEDLHPIDSSYEELLAQHVEIHGPLFRSAAFSLNTDEGETQKTNEDLLLQAYRENAPAALIEKLWSYGRYLLLSSSRAAGQPCPLLGLWHGDYRAFWSFNMLNENIQMIYWGALSGNMPELLLAVFDYYESMMEDFHLNARNLFGCRGIFIPAVTTPMVGTIQCLGSHIIPWTAGAGWLGQHYFDYYLYTEDMEFLKNRALPFLREVALFYEDFFILDDRGLYMSVPSVSPENTPGNYCGEDYEGPKAAVNATMDFAVAKEVLTNLLQGCEITGLYRDEREAWGRMLDKIPPYEINEDGAVREWMHPLFAAFVTAIKKRMVIGLTSQTSWSLAHMACNCARMEEGGLALECLDNICRAMVMNNLFTVHNDWRGMGIGMDMDAAPFQIDANMGITAAINEMLLFSKPGYIKILPALPAQWKKGSATGLGVKGGIIADIQWDMDESRIHVALSCKREKAVDLIAPGEILRAAVQGEEWRSAGAKVEGVVLSPDHVTKVALEIKGSYSSG